MKKLLYILFGCIVAGSLTVLAAYNYATRSYQGVEKRINIAGTLTEQELEKLLIDSLGSSFGEAVYDIWKLRNGTVRRTHGSFIVHPGDKAYRFAMKLRGGMQDPVFVTIPNMRDYKRALMIVSSSFEFDYNALNISLDSVLKANGFSQEAVPAVILPDTYQYYWTSSPKTVAESIYKNWQSFWNNDRMSKAKKLNLAPLQVSILASIVEEESAKSDERPIIARLYLNRLSKNMKLQADPTVKYAVGDPTLRRILNKHLLTESPYNTYLIDGLPPGPIRMTDKSTLDAVLNAPHNNYLYMCAKDDFSGYHNFATSLNEHNANARRYHEALNRIKIK